MQTLATSEKSFDKNGGVYPHGGSFFNLFKKHKCKKTAMSTDADDLLSYQEGTKNAGAKLVRKFKAKAAEAVEKLKDPETSAAWHDNVSSDEALAAMKAGVAGLTASDLTGPMETRGKSNYLTSTGDKPTQDKWARESKEYRDQAKENSKNKKPIRTQQDRKDNIDQNMTSLQNIKRRKLGLSDIS